MYWVTPFHYLLEGFLAVAVHDQPVICQSGEFARFKAPPRETCEGYTRRFVAEMGGYVQTGAGGMCELCQYKTGDEFAKGFNVYYSHVWRDFGIFIGFVALNFAVVYFATYLRFKGKNPFKGWIGGLAATSKAKRKGKGKGDDEKREVQA